MSDRLRRSTLPSIARQPITFQPEPGLPVSSPSMSNDPSPRTFLEIPSVRTKKPLSVYGQVGQPVRLSRLPCVITTSMLLIMVPRPTCAGFVPPVVPLVGLDPAFRV